MCRIGTYHDFHGIGVTNLVFGLLCIILPDLALNEEASGLFDYDVATGNFVKANDAITVINGIFFLGVGICCMVLARRWMENLSLHRLMQVLLGLAVVSIILCPVTFALNVISAHDASDWVYPSSAADPLRPASDTADDAGDNSQSSTTTGTVTVTDAWTASSFAPQVIRCDGKCFSMILTLFMSTVRFFEYRIAICAVFSLIAFGAFFMNCVLVVLISRTKNFQALNYLPTHEPELDIVPHVAARNLHFQKADHNGSVVIQPLPEHPGPRTDVYTNGGSTVTRLTA